MANLQATTVTGKLTVTNNLAAGSYGVETFNYSHSSNGGGFLGSSGQTTQIVRAGSHPAGTGMYHWSYQLFAYTGGYPECPNSYFYICPIQKVGNSYGYSQVDIFGGHRGMAGDTYEQYYRILFSSWSDGCAAKVYTNYKVGTRLQLAKLDRSSSSDTTGTLTISDFPSTGGTTELDWMITYGTWGVPLLFKMNTSCGSDEYFDIRVRTIGLAHRPPTYGPVQMAANSTPNYGTYGYIL
jgi:hypothetical protein